ncbi:hypothetical protein SFRURICE_009021 [Spodoptera frugiperda]|nr:hypothetical protein SFRURICE_009021 [Spodoptera frugiperda]
MVKSRYALYSGITCRIMHLCLLFGDIRRTVAQRIEPTRNNNLWITQRVAPCGNRTRYPLRGRRLPSHRTNSAVKLSFNYELESMHGFGATVGSRILVIVILLITLAELQ